MSNNPGVGPRPSEDKPGEERRRGVSAERYVEEARRGQAQPQPAEASRDYCSRSEAPCREPPRAQAGAPGTLERPALDKETETEASPDRLWNVIVWDDPINLMSYVTYVFQKLFGYSLEVATRLMLEVHHEGRSIVLTTEREKAEHFVTRLHQYGLQATLERQEG